MGIWQQLKDAAGSRSQEWHDDWTEHLISVVTDHIPYYERCLCSDCERERRYFASCIITELIPEMDKMLKDLVDEIETSDEEES